MCSWIYRSLLALLWLAWGLSAQAQTELNVSVTGMLHPCAQPGVYCTFGLANLANRTNISSSTGHGGMTPYTSTILPGTVVRLEAPLDTSERVFSHWVGCDITFGDAAPNVCEWTATDSSSKNITAVYTQSNTKLINLSTRAWVGTGDKVMIAGFIVNNAPKKLLLAARSLSLDLSTEKLLPDPVITLYSGANPIAVNDNWQDNDSATQNDLTAAGLAPSHATEAAMVVTLSPGPYTLIVSGKNQQTGIALVEVTDLDDFSTAGRLVNLSTRAYTSTGGDEQVIAGFIILGGTKTVTASAIGPGLAQYGVLQAQADPDITLFSGSTVLATSDNWSETEFFGIGKRTNNLQATESAILKDLPSGAYTVISKGLFSPGIVLLGVDE